MGLYMGIDLHESNSYVAIIYPKGKRLLATRVFTEPQLLTTLLKPYGKKLQESESVRFDYRHHR